MLKDIFTKKENQIMLGVVFISFILIIIGFYYLNKTDQELGPRIIPNLNNEIMWNSFENNKYNLNIEYPKHFHFYEDEKSSSGPVINFYFDKGKNILPFDHFTNQSQISIFPEGVSTGGVNFASEQSEIINSKGVEFVVEEYKTFSGGTWALMVSPKNTPESWKDWGFIWISSEIKKSETLCFDGNTKVDLNYCNPFEGDQVFQEGEVDEEFIEIGREFIDKISF